MRRIIGRPRIWVVITLVLSVVGLFVLDGPAAGAVLFGALATLIISCFLALRGEHPEDRTVGSGLFGGWL